MKKTWKALDAETKKKVNAEFLRRFDKRADDPGEALKPNVKGLKMPRMATPRLRKGTKGQVPVNPFSGNWTKAPTKVATTVGDVASEGVHRAQQAGKAVLKSDAPGVAHSALGLGALIGAGVLAKRTAHALRNPYEEGRNLRRESAKVHVARGGVAALSSPTAQRLVSSQ